MFSILILMSYPKYFAGTVIVPPVPEGSRYLLCRHVSFLILLYHMGGGADHLLPVKICLNDIFYKPFAHISTENGAYQSHPKFNRC